MTTYESCKDQYKTIIETTKDGYWVNDSSGKILEVNGAYCEMSGYTKEELLCISIIDIEANESAVNTNKHIEKIIQKGSDIFETRHRAKNGLIYDVEITVTFLSQNGGLFFVFIRDISLRKQYEKELLLSSKVFSTMGDGVIITDIDLNIIDVNDSFCKITGYVHHEILGNKPSMFSSGWMEKEFYLELWNRIKNDGYWQGEIIDRKKNGEIYTSETSIVVVKNKEEKITHYIAISSDITIKKEQEKAINSLAYYDTLTKLPNRFFFEERVNTKVASAKRNSEKIALLFIDLDNFKTINDSFGHMVGDKFLQNVAQILKSCVREEDIVGRFGGDEFMILIKDFNNIADLAIISTKITGMFTKPFRIGKDEVFSGASIGISVFPENGDSYHELMYAADTAMYHAKVSRKGGYEFYSAVMGENVAKRLEFEKNLRKALENDEFHMVYQPKIDLTQNRIYGMEALIRWVNPVLGFVSPDQFIPILEENGFIYEVGLWIIKRTLSDTKKFHELGFEDLIVSINVSYIQLENERFVIDFRDIVNEIGVPREFIELEITESQIMNNIEAALVKLDEITKCGVKISIDDFGTGYSSLSYLKKLPAKTIKIDKSFVLDIDKDENDKSIVKAIIELSKSLNKSVIAEGSETQNHIDILKELGCDKVQGYFYSKPLKYDDFIEYINTFKKR
ncbi:MAG: EAL domain-containing protein [Thiovulaceae bacterium]|nr:EAL domain-containing protein [Sulfurimonadaceae bacterium]